MKEEKFDFRNETNSAYVITIFDGLIDINHFSVEHIKSFISSAKNMLWRIYDIHPNRREEVYNWLEYQIKEIKRILESNEIEYKGERLELLNGFSNIINEIFKKPIQEVPILKLKINAPANVIYDLIKQLKPICIEDKNPFLPQSNKQIAEFLINYVEGFENLSITTVSTEIGREHNIKKSSIKVKQQN